MPALPATPSRLTALYGEDGGVVLTVGEICAPEKAEHAIFQRDASNLLHYLHPKEVLGKIPLPFLGKGWHPQAGAAGTGEVTQWLARDFHRDPAQGASRQLGWGVHRSLPTGSCPSYSSGWCPSSLP